MWTTYLDWGLADFSGYIAADELYDGPFCVLSIVDNRTFKRLLYQVLDHDPDHKDITAFFHRFRMALRLRRLRLQGVTTDASPLYPEPLREVFGDVPHQICEFHIIKELTKAILRAVAKVRKTLAGRQLPAKRGRPATAEAKRAARKRERLKNKIADLFEHRHLFVQHELTPAERRRLQKITRGLPQLRTLRDLMEQVYRVFSIIAWKLAVTRTSKCRDFRPRILGRGGLCHAWSRPVFAKLYREHHHENVPLWRDQSRVNSMRSC